MNERYQINSLLKGLSVLQALGASSQGLTATEVAKFLKTNNATASRFCYTLQKAGLVGRDRGKRYYLTSKVLSLGLSYFAALPKEKLVVDVLRDLADDLKETVSLSILDGTEAVYLVRFPRRQHLPFTLQTGSRIPAYCSSMGRVLLAFAAPGVASRILARSALIPLTPHTITNPDELAEELKRVRRLGYAIADQQSVLGARALAAPIVNADGYALAAISVSAPTSERTLVELENVIAPQVLEAARRISSSLQLFDDPFHTGENLFRLSTFSTPSQRAQETAGPE